MHDWQNLLQNKTIGKLWISKILCDAYEKTDNRNPVGPLQTDSLLVSAPKVMRRRLSVTMTKDWLDRLAGCSTLSIWLSSDPSSPLLCFTTSSRSVTWLRNCSVNCGTSQVVLSNRVSVVSGSSVLCCACVCSEVIVCVLLCCHVSWLWVSCAQCVFFVQVFLLLVWLKGILILHNITIIRRWWWID